MPRWKANQPVTKSAAPPIEQEFIAWRSMNAKSPIQQLWRDHKSLTASSRPFLNWAHSIPTMQLPLLFYISLVASLGCSQSAAAFEIPFREPPLSYLKKQLQLSKPGSDSQTPMNVPPAQIPLDSNNGGGGGEDDSGPVTGELTISDVLPQTRRINIFASLTRDVATVTARLESSEATENTTLLAPLNSAMQALPRKPWEDRPDDSSGVSAARNEEKAAQNLRRFVEEHVVPVHPWPEGKSGKRKTMGGGELWWETRDDGKTKVIMPGDIEVDEVVGTVGNGQVWAVKGVVNYV